MKIAQVFASDKLESRGIKFTSYLKKKRIDYVCYLKRKDQNYFDYIIKSVNGILRENIDIIHAHRISGFVPAIILKILKPKLKIIYDKHDIHKYDFIFDRLLFFADYVLVASELHLNRIKKYKKNCEVIPNYSDFKELSKTKREKIRNSIGLDKKNVVILFQGSIVPEYGLEMLINSLPNLNKNIKLCILGWIKDKEYWNKLNKRFTDQIIYLGPKKYSKMNDYVGCADIGVVLFKDSELTRYGNPAKLFEFISCKIPVIVTNIVSINKYVQKYKNGLIINNEKKLTQAINLLSKEDIRVKFSKNSPNLKWDEVFKTYFKILKNLKNL
jgi:glycosyltransferase involved in cell wall biosynthesis